MRKFNVTGVCTPEENYMVDITGKLEQIKKMVDDKAYFTIKLGKQYGKTTTLARLRRFLSDDYIVISLSFEASDEEEFANTAIFGRVFFNQVDKALRFSGIDKEYRESWKKADIETFNDLSGRITDMCEGRKVVLLIDAVDKADGHRVFLGFLSILRDKFLARRGGRDFTFHSVILAMIQEGHHKPSAGETSMYNSPWNIASDFEVDMSFSISEIAGMLLEYEKDYQTGMNASEIATEIYHYTSGYPVLVSRICKFIDEKFEKNWSLVGVKRAVKFLITLEDSIPLFDSLFKYLENDPAIYKFMYSVLFTNERWSFTLGNPVIALCHRYGLVKNVDNRVKISNKIFELLLIDYFVSKEKMKALMESDSVTPENYSDIVQNGVLNMQTCLEKFAVYYHQHYSEKDLAFVERESRFFFLFFINPVLNGYGFSHIESHFTDDRRMDVVVNYLNQQFVIELKIWRGEKRHQEAYEQLQGYMDKLNLDEGYLLTFDFREDKLRRQEWVEIGEGKRIFDLRV